MNVQIEEFPHICPVLIRRLVIRAAWEANILAQQGETVVGVGIKERDGRMWCSTRIEDPSS
jgi:hypothetical protein